MITFLLVIVNAFILLGLIHIGIKHLLSKMPLSIRLYASALTLLVLLSFIYFLSLILKLDFDSLLILFTIINLAHLYWTFPHFKNLYKSVKELKINYDIIPSSAILLMALFFVLHASKYGFFDAWALWNTHAKFLYHAESWTHMFADQTYESSSDYPLFLPGLIAFFWKGIGNTSFIVPMVLSFSSLAAIPVLLYYALKDEFSTKGFGVLAMALLIADYRFQSFNSEQCADIPLSLFILMTFVTYYNLKKYNVASASLVVGFICASCTWVKNEGELFYLIFSVGFVLCNFKNSAYLKRYFIGSILPLAVTIGFKKFYAPSTDFFASNHNSISKAILNLKDLNRYVVLIKLFSQLLVDNFWIAIVFVFSVFLSNRSFFKSFYFIVIFLMLLGYTFVYLISPYDLPWHIFTSFNRLVMQIYPSLIFTAIVSYKQIGPQFKLNHKTF